MGVNIFLVLGAFLVLLLAVLLVLFFSAKKKKAFNQSTQKGVKELSELLAILKEKSISAQELQKISQEVLKVYGKIDDFSIYEEIILRIILHPNTNKNIILNFDKELSRLNPAYKKKISLAVTDALDSREA